MYYGMSRVLGLLHVIMPVSIMIPVRLSFKIWSNNFILVVSVSYGIHYGCSFNTRLMKNILFCCVFGGF